MAKPGLDTDSSLGLPPRPTPVYFSAQVGLAFETACLCSIGLDPQICSMGRLRLERNKSVHRAAISVWPPELWGDMGRTAPPLRPGGRQGSHGHTRPFGHTQRQRHRTGQTLGRVARGNYVVQPPVEPGGGPGGGSERERVWAGG